MLLSSIEGMEQWIGKVLSNEFLDPQKSKEIMDFLKIKKEDRSLIENELM